MTLRRPANRRAISGRFGTSASCGPAGRAPSRAVVWRLQRAATGSARKRPNGGTCAPDEATTRHPETAGGEQRAALLVNVLVRRGLLESVALDDIPSSRPLPLRCDPLSIRFSAAILSTSLNFFFDVPPPFRLAIPSGETPAARPKSSILARRLSRASASCR